MIMNLLVQIILSFIATVSFSVLFNVPKKELVFCGLTGAVGWLFYQIVLIYFEGNLVSASFAGTLAITICGRVLCYERKTPVSIYLISGIIPIVPGSNIYYTMYSMMIDNDNMAALSKGVEALKIASVIVVGIIFILSLPRGFFDWKKPVANKTDDNCHKK